MEPSVWQTPDGLTALLGASRFNPNLTVVTRLLQAGADLHARAADGLTALTAAAAHNQQPAVTAALLAGWADVEETGPHGTGTATPP
jgi:ankyrin repeat protein